MQPFHSSFGPAIEPGALERLRRLDRNLSVTYSPFALDPLEGTVLEHEGHPIPSPGWYLWLRTGDGRVRLVDYYRVERGFGHREVCHLERRAAVVGTPSEQVRKALAKIEDSQALRKRRTVAFWHDVFRANAKRMLRNADPTESVYRDPKVYGYRGQTKRTSSGEGGRARIMKDARQDGWELPSQSDRERAGVSAPRPADSGIDD